MTFTFKAQPMPGWDGVVRCEILEVDEPRRLRYSWVGGGEASRIDTVVTWTLTPNASGGTRLRLEHSGFTPANGMAFDGLGRGWRGKVAERMSAALAAALAPATGDVSRRYLGEPPLDWAPRSFASKRARSS